MLATVLATSAFAANDKPASKTFQGTTDPKYDRNPSFFRAADGTYWLFFTRGKDNRGIRDFQDYNPDLDYYDIYYRTARSIPELQKADENIIRLKPPDNAQRDISAFQTRDGKIWVFTSTGLGPGSQRSVYFYTFDGSWQGPTPVPETDNAAHINALKYNGKIWVFFDVGYILEVVSYDEATTTWSAPVTVAGTDATVAKAMVDDGKFYVVWTTSSGAGIHLSISADGINWSSTGNTIASWSGATNWDPVLTKERDTFRLFWAPDAGPKGQFIATSSSKNPIEPTSWSPPVKLTNACYNTNNWWDFWPQVYSYKGESCLFYTSERDKTGKERTDGNIWMLNLPESIIK
jgi:hypothetical protein